MTSQDKTDMTVADNRAPIQVLRDRLEARKAELAAAMPDIPPEVFIRSLMTSVQINPEILSCSWQSIWIACMKACRDGLLPDGVDGIIVAFKSQAQWLPMYTGLLRRFRRSGQFKWITAGVVRKGEPFEHWIDENGDHFKHVPGSDIKAPIEQVYALAKLKDNQFFCAVLPIAEAEKIKNMSRATREDSPWRMWESEMLKKTALRRLCKMLPSARDLIGEEIDEPTTPLIQERERVREQLRPVGAAAALEQFAGSTPDEVSASSPPAESGSGEAVASVPDDASPAADPLDPLGGARKAYKAGQRAKETGALKSAVPELYRHDPKLKHAWTAGWLGEEFNMAQ